jgi:hypothetical protein
MTFDPLIAADTEPPPSGDMSPKKKHSAEAVRVLNHESSADPFVTRSQTIPGPLPRDVFNPLDAREYFVEIITDLDTLRTERKGWDDLFEHSIDRNIFYSSDLLLPALENLRPAGTWKFVVLKSRNRSAPNREPEWCGFFPLVEKRRLRGIPIRNLQFVKHDYCFLRTPLLRQDAAAPTLTLFVDWLLKESKSPIIDFAEQSGDGPYHSLLVDELHRRGIRPWITGVYGRALMRRAPSDDAYLRASISSSRLKELRRLARRLAEEGPVRFESLGPDGDLDMAIEEFLKLENSGWKHTSGTAIDCSPDDRAFFKEVCRNLFEKRRLRLHFLRVGETLVAAKCNFLAPPASFAFKIAFLEEKFRYSPGVQLEIDNIRRFHSETNIDSMDSCADPEHPMIDHLWQEKRLIQNWIVPLRPIGTAMTILLPLLSVLKRAIVRRS